MANLSIAASSNALRNLQIISKDMTATQNRVASGLKVASARDNASVWVAATNIRADIDKQSTVESGITIAKGRADITLETLGKIKDVLDKMVTISADIINTTDAATEATNVAVAAKLKPYQDQLKALTSSGAFQGANWLASSGATNIVLSTNNGVDVTHSFTATKMYDGSVGSLETSIEYDGLGQSATATTEKAKFTGAVTAVNTYIAQVSGLADTLSLQQDFLSKLDGIRQTALSQLVDADMTVESAKLSALQVREQLTYQTLSMINSSQQNVLRLFQ